MACGAQHDRGRTSTTVSQQPLLDTQSGWGRGGRAPRVNRFGLRFDQIFFYMVLTDIFQRLGWLLYSDFNAK